MHIHSVINELNSSSIVFRNLHQIFGCNEPNSSPKNNQECHIKLLDKLGGGRMKEFGFINDMNLSLNWPIFHLGYDNSNKEVFVLGKMSRPFDGHTKDETSTVERHSRLWKHVFLMALYSTHFREKRKRTPKTKTQSICSPSIVPFHQQQQQQQQQGEKREGEERGQNECSIDWDFIWGSERVDFLKSDLVVYASS